MRNATFVLCPLGEISGDHRRVVSVLIEPAAFPLPVLIPGDTSPNPVVPGQIDRVEVVYADALEQVVVVGYGGLRDDIALRLFGDEPEEMFCGADLLPVSLADGWESSLSLSTLVYDLIGTLRGAHIIEKPAFDICRITLGHGE